jgi:hypothetical protein
LDYNKELIENLFKFKNLEKILTAKFNTEPVDNYHESLSEIEQLITAEMTHFLDKRIIEYTTNNPQEVNNLKRIVKKKERFPKDLFQNLKKAFPCILA